MTVTERRATTRAAPGPRPAQPPRAVAVGVPRLLYVLALAGLALLTLPVLALLVRADWPGVPAAITSPEALSALGLSLRTALAATALCLLLGVPLAVVLARTPTRAADVVRALVTLPLVLPPTVGGIALLYLLGRRGLVGEQLDLLFGIRIPFTTTAVVIAQAFVALPFLVIALEGALRSAGDRYEVVAATLGAGRWTVLRRITLPLAAPGLVSGTVLCFARALGEFGATALFAGNSAGVTRTMPLAIYTAFNGAGVTQDSAVALSLLLVVVAVVILVLARAWKPGGRG
ncbi:ABC transporter permease [Cellulomonas chengniuliangii]|uniref:Molybdenum transport system permease n=1 Tax=Cellulomonas chengniuliangii TaxID=2968084 RepID=A0ABY5KXE3_9CELL|nr:ABC transporter permease [Cellulomonas chengniuliangii]MCC2308517.1 ABC transporter permease [Cellulomonas chengniuliangii]MCC2317534.1 ABC transporter permease [Cellulomonas chengniuliangii]UUI73881.1 ABC transporter permease [Cellulomonas chengniuliangii]